MREGGEAGLRLELSLQRSNARKRWVDSIWPDLQRSPCNKVTQREHQRSRRRAEGRRQLERLQGAF